MSKKTAKQKHQQRKQTIKMIDELLAFIEDPETTQIRLASEKFIEVETLN